MAWCEGLRSELTAPSAWLACCLGICHLPEAQCAGSWPVVLQLAIVEDAAIVHFPKSQFEYKIGDSGLRILSFSE
jgi:hypothetical protein